jgi:two-component system sensor histidine kinase KdpD
MLPRRGGRVVRYSLGLLLVLAATGLSALVTVDFSPTNLIMIYLLAVVVAAVYLGRGPAMLAALTGVLAFDFFFVPPQFTLSVADVEYLLSMAGFLLVGIVISYLAAEASSQAEVASRREAETAALYAFSRDLATADDLNSLMVIVSAHLANFMEGQAAVFLPEAGRLRLQHGPATWAAGPNEAEILEWVFQHIQAAGKGTENYPTAGAVYLPLHTAQSVLGVLAARPYNAHHDISSTQQRLLEAYASQAALAIEHHRLAEQTRQIELLQATEKLQNALLNSISHDLRTPLVSITGALSTLDDSAAAISPEARQSLIETAREEADRLNRLVGNLLDMTRLEAGALRLRREPADLQDLVGAALSQLESRLTGRSVQMTVPSDLPLVTVDFVLLVHALANLLDNALKYSPDATPLEVQASQVGAELQLAILDRGVGIPDADLEHIFDKFFRVQRSEQVTGTGLGLAISKGIIEAHGGRIWAANRPDGGMIFTLALPIERGPESE